MIGTGKICICLKCGHKWESRKRGQSIPAACPKCKRYDWFVPVTSEEQESPMTEKERKKLAEKLDIL